MIGREGVAGWPEVTLFVDEFDFFGQVLAPQAKGMHKLRCRVRMPDKLPEPEAKKMPAIGSWAWLPGDQIETNSWTIQLRIPEQNPNGPGNVSVVSWGAAVLPRNWDGSFDYLVRGVRRGENFLVGEYGQRDRFGESAEPEGYWMVEVSPQECPEWPKLEAGAGGIFRSGELDLIGVLAQQPFSRHGLTLAWGNTAGEVLGWERVAEMREVRAARKRGGPGRRRQVRDIGQWKGFGEFEKELRKSAYGREI